MHVSHDNDTPPDLTPAMQHVTKQDLRDMRKEMLANFQHIVETIESNREAVSTAMGDIRKELSDAMRVQAVFETRLSMIERALWPMFAVIVLAFMSGLVALVWKGTN